MRSIAAGLAVVVVGLPALAQEPRPGSPDAGSAQPPSPDLAQSPASSAGARLRFDIPGQPLRTALLAFGRQAGLQVTVDAATTAGKTAQAVSGSLTAEEALTRLLAGTGLTWRYLDARTVTLEPAAIRQDDGPMRLDPVTVTARRTEELLQDVPQSVVAIDTEEIERSNIETLEDYFERAPNVAFTENGTRA
ncbi:MAG: TonB-dependent receptor, partial [Kiloniellales bacterium]|nr:TonB-dependent receptor [Kiloniellales bacterium]